MIRNIDQLPIGVRHALFNSDWLTDAELATVRAIAEMAIADGRSKMDLALQAKVSPGTVYSLFNGRKVGFASIWQMSEAFPADQKRQVRKFLTDVGDGVEYTIEEYTGRVWTLRLDVIATEINEEQKEEETI